jgi:hypothetical protein
MPESISTPPMPQSARRAASDRRILAHVEKWMAMIQEISREQQEQQRA